MNADSGGIRIGRWLFGGVIALNVALVFLLGAILLGWRGSGGPVGAPLPSPHMLRQALPQNRAQLVNWVLDQHKGEIRSAMRQQRQARRALYAALRKAELEPEELSARFADLRETEQATAAVVHDMLSDLLSQLTLEERRQVADLFARRGHHGRDRRDERRNEKAAEQAEQSETSPP